MKSLFLSLALVFGVALMSSTPPGGGAAGGGSTAPQGEILD